MADVDFFSSFGYQWAQGATSYGWDDAQWKNGWLSIGSTPPSVGQFDAVQKITDLKLKYVFDAINSIAASGGLTLTSSNASSLSSVLYRNATTTLRGMVILASATEVQTGTEATKAITSSALNSRTATETRTGLVELATPAEVIAGTDATRATTPAGLAAFSAAKNEKDPTETERGMPLVATAAETLDGVAGKLVDPARLRGVTFNSAQVVYATPGVFTWIVPDILRLGLKKARVRGVGGGGGGARRANSNLGQNCTGGAGGGYFEILLDFTGVESVPVTVGAGGTSGPVDSPATSGGTTSFGTYASASGGAGGQVTGNLPIGGAAASSAPGALLVRGSTASTSVLTPSGNSIFGGSGGSSVLGFGGPASQTGTDASGYGSGGGGSVDGSAKAGQPGVVIIEW